MIQTIITIILTFLAAFLFFAASELNFWKNLGAGEDLTPYVIKLRCVGLAALLAPVAIHLIWFA
jgi:hypothetical protein